MVGFLNGNAITLVPNFNFSVTAETYDIATIGSNVNDSDTIRSVNQSESKSRFSISVT